MKNLRSAISLILSGVLIAFSPGLAPYRAFAQTYTPAAAAATAGNGAAAAGGVPVQLGVTSVAPASTLQLAPVPALKDAAAALTPNLLSAPAAAALPGAAVRTQPAGRVAADGVAGVMPTGLAAARRAGSRAASSIALPGSATARPAGVKAQAAQAAAAETKRGAPSAMERLQKDVPDYGRMGADSARRAWDEDAAFRTGQSGMDGVGSVEASALLQGSLRGSSVDGSAVLLKKGEKRTPERGRRGPHYEDPAPGRGSDTDVSDLDELGNPRRQQDDGPDSVSDEFGGGGGRGNSDLFAWFPGALTLSGVAGLAALGHVVMIPLYLGLIIPSLILHEMGHGRMAERLGDPTPRLQGRLSFRPRDLLTHIDPVFTLVVPILTMLTAGFLFGGANPVRVNTNNLLRPTTDMAKIAIAGPAVNFGLAVLGGFAYMAAASIGMPAVAALLTMFVFFNVMLGLFNLLPFAPLDGHHIVRWALNSEVVNRIVPGREISAALDRNQGLQMALGFIAVFTLLAGPLVMATQFLTGLFLGGVGLASVQLASGALPALAGVGLMLGSILGKQPEGVRKLNGPVEARLARKTAAETPGGTQLVSEPVTLLVRLTGSPKPLPRFVHMDLVPRPTRSGLIGQAEARYYAEQYGNLTMDLEAAGLSRKLLEQFGASPVAAYDLINTATIVVPADKAAAFRAAMAARGFKVEENAERHIIQPVEPEPNRPDAPSPGARGAVTTAETLSISKAGPAHEAAKKLWGPPEFGMSFVARLTLRALRLFGAKVPEVKLAVIDSGIDPKHKVMKNVELLNATKGKPEDDIGHGNWTHGMALSYAPWNKSSIHIKAFLNGGATLDDILKALSMAREKGAIIISNSWGSDDGDPDGADTRMLVEMSKEGRISVNAAGNAGSGKNTVGSPAIGYYVDPQSGAPRMLAVAATDREKKVAYFSSRGPGSPTTAGNDKYKDWPRRPDLAEQGYNTEGPWPTYMRADRVDPVYGPVKAISGTSMSTPKVAGTIALLAMLFGATAVGPKLDAVVKAVMGNLEKLGAADDLGQGFNVVSAAFDDLSKQLKPLVPGPVAKLAVWAFEGKKSSVNAARVALGAAAFAIGLAGLGAAFMTLGSVGLAAAVGSAALGAVGLAVAGRLAFGTIGTGRPHSKLRDAGAAAVGAASGALLSFGLFSTVFDLVYRLFA